MKLPPLLLIPLLLTIAPLWPQCTAGRVVSLPDLHGDLFFTLATLLEARLINDEGFWIGGRDILVQTGDVVDRGPDTRYVLDYLDELGQQAAEVGGSVIRLMGNHEVMNLMDDYRYVAPEDAQSFRGAKDRRAAFSSNGPYGQRIMSFRATVLLNDTVFVHAGLVPEWAKMGVAEINRRAARAIAKKDWDNAVLMDEGPFWTRRLVYGAEANDCSLLRASLAALSAAERRPITRMVVGHTPADVARTFCDGALLAMDAAISRQMGGGRVAALLLSPVGPNMLSASVLCHDGTKNRTLASAVEERIRRRWTPFYKQSNELPPKVELAKSPLPPRNVSRLPKQAIVSKNAENLFMELQSGPLRDLPLARFPWWPVSARVWLEHLYLMILLASTALIAGLMCRRPLPDVH